MRLIYLSPVPWASFAQRPHKFVEWFHGCAREEVLWIDPYPTRFPSLSDFRRVGTQEDRQQCFSPPWLRVIKPPAAPIEPLPGSGWVHSLFWRQLFNEIDTFAGYRPALLTIGKPSVLALEVVERFRGGLSVYDAMDDFPAFYSGLSRLGMRWREQKLVRRVDTVLASSSAIKRRWSAVKGDVRLVHNGLDLHMLPPSRPINPERTQKVLGYVGTVATWFDWAWVIKLAQAQPTHVVRLIGPMFVSTPVALPKNIEILPPCNHQAALAAMQDFDVGLIPFKKNDLTASVDPIKYYEYRALGLPVISTDFGEMALRTYEEGTFISRGGGGDINELLQKAIRYSVGGSNSAQFAEHNSWEVRFAGAGLI